MVERKKSTKAAAEGEKLDDGATPTPIDHTTGKPFEESSGPGGGPELLKKSDAQPGAEISGEDEQYGVTVDERGNVSVLPKGWVGPPPLTVHSSKLDALIDALQRVKKAKPVDVDEEFVLERGPDGLVHAEEKTPHAS